ncbi:MAG: UDP-glucose/GDP-mannose dehydrogenase family protein [Alphaproteobacteria bacterium]|nr:UDP-glucose/GDP-mannose dehydrogenase family protein [Alphaproteobacteria bacterium]
MQIAMIGTGYVGLVSGACFSEFGFDVTCVDKDAPKIENLKNNKIPIYEPGLDSLVEKNQLAGRLSFSTNLHHAVKNADVVFIAVGTPTRRGDGHADLTYVFDAVREIAQALSGYTVIVTKSTVPVGTGRKVAEILKTENPEAEFDVASNPEFLREGSAINDFMRPDRVVVGTMGVAAKEVLEQVYRPLFLIETPIQFTSLESAELIKYAANAFLAVKISYINQIADLCEKLDADVHDVAKGMGLDKRIGGKFLHPGPGYGGSCFPKDTLALVKTAEMAGAEISIVDEVVRYNQSRKHSMASRIIKHFENGIIGKKISILGLSFKPETDDMRDSPALEIIPLLLSGGAEVVAYDPAAMEEAKKLLPEEVIFAQDAEACIKSADACVILTEWNEFRAITSAKFLKLMAGIIIVDLRNIYVPDDMRNAGVIYDSIGRA